MEDGNESEPWIQGINSVFDIGIAVSSTEGDEPSVRVLLVLQGIMRDTIDVELIDPGADNGPISLWRRTLGP